MDVRKHLEKAQASVNKKNYDYAITLYGQVLAMHPDEGQARSELRHALSKRFDSRKVSPLLMRLTTLPHAAAIAVARLTKNRESLVRACERYLMENPYSISVNMLLGRSLETSGHINSAVAVYEFVAHIDQGNVEALKRAGLLKYRNKDIAGALKYYEKVLSINPRDAEAEKMRKNLAAEGTLASGSYATAKSSHELIREKEEAAHLQRKSRIHKTAEEIDEEIAHLEKQRAGGAPDGKLLRDLSDLYIRKRDYKTVRALYDEMLELDPESFDIRCRIGDLEIRLLSEKIDVLENKWKAERSDELKAEIKTLYKQRLDRQVKEYAWRVREHPTDMGLWFTYGQYAITAGETDEAIRAFQQSVKDPRHKVRSLHMLGKAFTAKDLFDLAENQLKTALEASGGVSEKNKAICYDLGLVCEKQKENENALNWYLKIFEIDINYKDVASKIEKLKPSI